MLSINTPSINEIIKVCREANIEPRSLSVSKEMKDSMKIEIDMLENTLNNKVSLYKDFKLISFDYEKNSYKVSRSIEDNDFNKFKGLVPEQVHTFWDNIYSEFNIYSNKIN